MSERRFDPEKMEMLDNPERRKALPPDQLLQLSAIGRDDVVLDLGAGTGYFTLPAANMTDNKVYALDIEPKMLSVLKSKLEELHIENVEPVEGKIENIPLPDSSVDRVIASFVLHEVEPLSKGLEEIQRVLKKNGTCFCLEWEKKPMEQGPPLHHRIHSTDMRKAMETAGFEIVKSLFPTDFHYILVVRK
ncbi:class I SAM-dependent methyltransferase [Effusibacillus pohliae]|uniref:class I SAM-dependent methyltransferase n=1 Tax=Effusibacillus pohliae TaxID=232270 RepID=UPI00036E4E80|nr:class I SAM-dependent methyltransferase [Effusibacillus pohliae]